MQEETEFKLRFGAGAVEVGDLEAEISATLRELADPTSETAKSAIAAGLDPADLANAHASVMKESKGFGPVIILVAIAAPVAAHIANKFWDDVIWPRIKSKLGSDSLGEPKGEE